MAQPAGSEPPASAVEGGGAKKVTHWELLRIREKAWERPLRGSSLVAELEVKDAHSEQVARVLGKYYAHWIERGRRVEDLFAQWPACVAVAVTGIAARYYEKGTFWPHFWEVLRYPGAVDDQAMWGNGFVAALDALGLPTFPDMPMPYVGPILMHTGIPTFCLDDFFRLIAQRRAIDAGLDAEGFLAWATGREHRIDCLDVPAQRFLQHGTDYALDFVERSFDLLDRLREPEPDLDGVRLPPRVIERAQRLAAAGGLDFTPKRARSSAEARRERPRIALDPFGRGVVVVLPAIGETPDGYARWNVTADGVTTVVRSQPQWAGLAEGAPSTMFGLLSPVRTVVATLEGWRHQTELEVVDPAAPLLVFAEDGRRLPAGLPLPPDVVWVVYPAENELVADGDLTVLVEGELPLGWSGWRLRQISLRDARSLGLCGLARTHRPVRGHARPRVITGDPVPGVTTPYGTQVYTSPPQVWLPAEASADTTWLIEVRSSGDGQVIAAEKRTISEPSTITDLWDSLPRPLLGAYEITVRGPLGRGVKRSVFVAEGLRVRFTPRVRMFGAAGLVPGRADVTAADGAQAHPARLSFSPDEPAHVIEYRTAAETEQLVITPPHVQVMHERPDAVPVWRAGSLRIATDVFDEHPGALLVAIPEAPLVPPLRVVVGDQTVQDVPPSGRASHGSARYDLTKIADTVREHRRADLLLDVPGATIRLATVRPRRIAEGVEHQGERLRLINWVPVDGLTAGVYVSTAPWREPYVVPVDPDGGIPLPVALRNAGPLHVYLQVDDPWVPAEWPRWPEHFLTAPGHGYLLGEDPEETALSRFVAGEGDFPAEVRDLRRAWILVHLARRLRSSSDVQWLLMACSRVLRSRPGEALVALADLGLDPDDMMLALISSGLAAEPVPDAPSRPSSELWPVAPAVAVLAGGLSDPECLSVAERQCGAALAEILNTGHDSLAQVGRFGRETEPMVHMTPQQLEGIWSAAKVVPRALLDEDTRLSAARRLFDARKAPAAKDVGKVADFVVKTARKLLPPRLLRQVDVRRHPDGRGGWYAIPAASAAFALIARQAARGDEACRSAEQNFRSHWAQLATVAPSLVCIDFVLAELLAGAGNTEEQ